MSLSGPVIIVAGGTGGHLFPGQALAQELGRRAHKVILVTDSRVRRYKKQFPADAVFEVSSAPLSGRNIFKILRGFFLILAGLVQALWLLHRLRPGVLVGFGGYPTLPPVLAALLWRMPVCVHEQNAVLGRVNRLVLPWIAALASTFATPKYLGSRYTSKVVVTGNPVRDGVMALAGSAYRAPGEEENINLLIYGGSQGARILSEVVPGALGRLPASLRSRLRIVQQCRMEDREHVENTYRFFGMRAELSDFFDDLPQRIANAHLVIGRSGASTISELTVIGRPSLLVPLYEAIDGDQEMNAAWLSQKGAAWVMRQDQLNEQALADRLTGIFGFPDGLEDKAAAALQYGHRDATQRLADLVERVGQKDKPLASSVATGKGDRS